MDLYAKIRDLDSRVRAGETTLLAVLDELRLLRAERLTRTQLETATKPNDMEPEPEPEPVPYHGGLAPGLVMPQPPLRWTQGGEPPKVVEQQRRKPGRPRRV